VGRRCVWWVGDGLRVGDACGGRSGRVVEGEGCGGVVHGVATAAMHG
jgi:hypothetical protein